MTVSGDGPTRGAFESSTDRRWQSLPGQALGIRVLVAATPIVGAFVGLLLVADLLFRPAGFIGLILWLLQSVIVGTALSMTIELLTRQLLPLAALFDLSLVFPDRAPSRFGIALRSGTLKRLQERSAGFDGASLGPDAGTAAVRAVEFVTVLGRHDRLTRGHTERVRAYADLIATQMGLSDQDRERLTWGVMLHDIGKVTVPGEVLNKSGKLTDEEWSQLRGHPEAGARMLAPLREWLGPWALAASEHHERWDGDGYPRGLQGHEISLAGRITAVADAYDVITSKRSYKEPMSAAAARRELVLCSGSQFDPDVVRAFLNVSLGRRWSGGVLAALSQLPIGNLGTAPVAVTVGAVMTAGAAVVGAVPAPVPEQLAFTEEPAEVVEMPDEDAEAGLPQTAVTVASSQEAATDPTTTEATPTSSAPTSSAPTPSGDGFVEDHTTSLDTSTTGSTAPTTSKPPSTAPSTSPPPTTTTATTAPSTTTTATTTTTAAPTTTTTAPTTTTTAPPSGVYYLENPNSDGQDSSAQLFKSLEVAAPVDGVQYNFDTNRDAIAGLSLQPTGSGWGESNTSRVQRYFLDGSANLTVTGPVSVRLWAATDSDGATATVRVSLADCNTSWAVSCEDPIAEATLTTSTWVQTGFQELVFDLGSPTATIGDNRRLVLRVIAEGSDTVHTAFDSTVYPSRIVVNLS